MFSEYPWRACRVVRVFEAQQRDVPNGYLWPLPVGLAKLAPLQTPFTFPPHKAVTVSE